MPTDRRARLCCDTCGTPLDDATADRNLLADLTFCDACLARFLAPLDLLGRPAKPTAADRRWNRRQRRLAIARRRQRIAAQPRVGDVALFGNVRCQVFQHGWDIVPCRLFTFADGHIGALILTEREWREAVRRAQMTQEGQIWRSV